MTCFVFLLSLVLILGGCPAPFRDPPVNLKTLAQPEPPPKVDQPTPTPELPPSAAPGRPGVWRAWVPREVQPNGDVRAGHYLEISETAPVLEVVEPVKGMPRVPRTPMAKPAPPIAPKSVPPPAAPQMPAWTPQGTAPQGWVPGVMLGITPGQRGD